MTAVEHVTHVKVRSFDFAFTELAFCRGRLTLRTIRIPNQQMYVIA